MDAYVAATLATTLGRMYAPAAGRLRRYPLPRWTFAPAHGDERWLELGCGWGRWTIAAQRAGFRAVGLDRNIAALAAARRVAQELGLTPAFVCGDAARLPFREAAFAQVFSYGVVQYIPPDCQSALAREAARVLAPGGLARLQWPHAGGLRRLPHWRRADVAALWSPAFGRLTFAAEGFLSTNARWEDRDLLPVRFRVVVAAAVALRRVAASWPWLLRFADAVWLVAEKPAA